MKKTPIVFYTIQGLFKKSGFKSKFVLKNNFCIIKKNCSSKTSENYSLKMCAKYNHLVPHPFLQITTKVPNLWTRHSSETLLPRITWVQTQ